jgi:DNA-directed RNA polymerase subunit RPC12/RpoP
MPVYHCRQCGNALSLKSADDEKLRYGEREGRQRTLLIKCPKCGTENRFTVPKK